MRLQLADQVHVGADHAAQHHVAAARNRVAVQDDGFGAAGNLNAAVGIAASTMLLGSTPPRKAARAARSPAPCRPGIGSRSGPPRARPSRCRRRTACRLGRDPVPVKPRQHPQFAGLPAPAAAPPAPRPCPHRPRQRQAVPRPQRPPLMAPQRAQGIGRPRAQLQGTSIPPDTAI